MFYAVPTKSALDQMFEICRLFHVHIQILCTCGIKRHIQRLHNRNWRVSVNLFLNSQIKTFAYPCLNPNETQNQIIIFTFGLKVKRLINFNMYVLSVDVVII